jgi:hypothetical protein
MTNGDSILDIWGKSEMVNVVLEILEILLF